MVSVVVLIAYLDIGVARDDMNQEAIATRAQEYETSILSIDAKDLIELKAVKVPTQNVQNLLIGLSYVLKPVNDKKKNTWKDVKLNDAGFLNKIRSVDIKALSIKQCHRAHQAIDGLSTDLVRKSSKAAAQIYNVLKAIVEMRVIAGVIDDDSAIPAPQAPAAAPQKPVEESKKPAPRKEEKKIESAKLEPKSWEDISKYSNS